MIHGGHQKSQIQNSNDSNEIKGFLNNILNNQKQHQQSSFLKWFSPQQQQQSFLQINNDFELIKQKLPQNVSVLSLKDIENY